MSSSSGGSADGIAQPAQRVMPVDSRTKVKNVVVAAALLSFVGLVYYTAISKMSKTDELSKIIEEEADR